MSARNPIFSPPPVHYRTRLPSPAGFGSQAFLIYDRRLLSAAPGFREWAARFEGSYAVTAGEGLKEIGAFAAHAERLLSRTKSLSRENATFVATGGGSVGDFAGFFASVWKRGAKLVQMPTTWLAAIDSAHGGKNALNAGGVKNALGTFHFPTSVEIVRPWLEAQPAARAREAAAELAKIGLLDGKPWFAKLARGRNPLSARDLWRALPSAIEAKYRFVSADPWERTGVRQLLNLGHTFGHVLERAHDLPHGTAVGEGLRFAIEWSGKRGHMKPSESARWLSLLETRFAIAPLRRRSLTPSRFLSLASGDKKTVSSETLRFVFLRNAGDALPERVRFTDFAKEAERQGWIR